MKYLLALLLGWQLSNPGSAVFAADANALIGQAKALMQSGKAAEAYDVLETDVDANAANVDYNYVLGIAALDSGKPGLAVFAFERVLTLNPQHLPARAELARAYLALGESDAAKEELEQVRQLNPPPEVARTIGDYLGAIDLYERDRQAGTAGATGLTGYVQMDLGFDTNINTATNATSVVVPLFGNVPFQLSPLFTAQSSTYSGLGAGANYQGKITENVTGFVGVNSSGRYNWREDVFYTYSYGGNAGIRVARGIDSYTVGVNTNQFFISNFHLDDYRGVFGEWQRQLNRNNLLTVFGQYFTIDHPFEHALDTRLYLGGATLAHAFEVKGSPIVSLSAYGASDKEQGNNPTVGRDYYGVRSSLQLRLSESFKLVAGVAAQHSRYGGTNVFFDVRRAENRYDGNLGLEFVPAKNWTITPQLLYTRNESNIPINDFDRKQALITVRRDFK